MGSRYVIYGSDRDATTGPDILSRRKKHMKRTMFLPIIMLLFAGAGFNCQPSKIKPASLTGKLVINKPCGHYVIQVLSGDVDPGFLVKSWRDSITNTSYSNVFTVANSCNFTGSGLSPNDVFTFKINDTSFVQNCMLCMIFYPTPVVSNTVSDIQLVR